jgi:hypothetical protein
LDISTIQGTTVDEPPGISHLPSHGGPKPLRILVILRERTARPESVITSGFGGGEGVAAERRYRSLRRRITLVQQ